MVGVSWSNGGGDSTSCGLIVTWFFVDDFDGIFLDTNTFGRANINDPACLRLLEINPKEKGGGGGSEVRSEW
jgi:hypothetical protein